MADSEAERERGIVRAYEDGHRIVDIEQQFGVGRSTIYHYLRRSGKVPSRARRQMDSDSKDAALAGLYELIRHQDRRIDELENENNALKAEAAKVKRQLAATRRQDGHAPGRPVASKESRAS